MTFPPQILTPEGVAAVIAAYERGDAVSAIATRHEIGKIRVGAIARKAGIPLRRQASGAQRLIPVLVAETLAQLHAVGTISLKQGTPLLPGCVMEVTT